MEYTVVESHYLVDLCKKVNSMLDDGWKIVGGHQVYAMQSSIYYSQTLVRMPGRVLPVVTVERVISDNRLWPES